MSQEKDKNMHHLEIGNEIKAEDRNMEASAGKTNPIPVLVWEHNKPEPEEISADKVVDLQSYRLLLDANFSEATVTNWQLYPAQSAQQPIKLIMISSGFAKGSRDFNRVQCLAA